MAQKGQKISNDRTGERITWIETAADSGGKRLVFTFEVEPKGKLPVVHLHPRQRETFALHKGSLALKIDKDEKTLNPGDSFTIECGIAHQWWNPSESETAEMTVTFEPALNTETFLEQFFGLCNAGKASPEGSPHFLQVMAMSNKYEIYIAGPPLPIQKAMAAVLGSFARLLGYRRFYPEYSKEGPVV